MTARRALRRLGRQVTRTPSVPLVVGIAGLIGMGLFLWLAPRAAAGGWLTAFLFGSGVPLGCLLLIMIHTLTGGRWGQRFAVPFAVTAAGVPLMALLVVPILAALPGIYPWVYGGGVHPDVAGWYLNLPFFVARTAIAFCGWSLIAFVLPRLGGAAAMIFAGAGLAFHGLMMSLIGYDWVLSLQPGFESTSFGATLCFVQIASALCWTILVTPARYDDPGFADLGGLLLATLLGITYINFMAVLVIWYGNLPERVAWFVARDHWPWSLIAVLAFLLGAVVPILALLLGRLRSDPRALRPIAAVTLCGLALYDAYLIVPVFGVLALAAALVALIAIGGLLIAFAATPWSRAPMRQWSSVHGR